jgi:uncharacterized protein
MVKKGDFLPDRDFALNLLRMLKIQHSIRQHSEKVADKALEIANKITKAKVDKNLVEVGSLLHDIGRTKTHGFDHALIGGKILRERGFSEKLAKICETHILGGLDAEDAREFGLPENEYLPISLEEKIICLADKLIAGTKEVSVEERFNRWFAKFGRSSILLKSKRRILQIQKEIESLM